MSRATRGSELMQRINDGRAQKIPSSVILKLRAAISAEIEELIETGARVRPLLIEGKRVGWVRGVHLAERKYLRRYFNETLELAEHIVRLGTSLDPDYLAGLSMVELKSLLRVINEMTNSDLRLYPFLGPFSTTSISEQLWFSKGPELTGCGSRVVEVPGGVRMTLLTAPDQARLWAWLCTYRERSKERNEATAQASIIIRPWAGKGADSLTNEVRQIAKALQADAVEPWVESIHYVAPVKLDDGWAHGEDSSPEGLMREIKGMLSNDRHEQVMAAFEKGLQKKATDARQKAEERIARFGGPGFIDQKTEILTADEVKARVIEMKRNRSKKRAQEEMLEQGSNAAAKLNRYE